MTTFHKDSHYYDDRKVGEFWYRWISEFEIRISSTGPANFGPWKEFTNPGDTRREWKRICNAAAKERLINQLIEAMHGLCKADDTIWLNPEAVQCPTMFEHLWQIAVENGGEDRLKTEFPEYA